MALKTLNVLIVDDTALYRRVLTEVITDLPDARVVGTARNGKMALEKLAILDVDLMLLDVEMPEMDGLETLKICHSRYPQVGVVMVSGLSDRAADITIQALQHGAIDFVPKPRTRDAQESQKALIRALKPLVLLQSTRKTLHFASRPKRIPLPKSKFPGAPAHLREASEIVLDYPEPEERQSPIPKLISIVAIGVSTGGPRALGEIIPVIRPEISQPIMIVQHMPPGFTRSLARQLDSRSQLTVKEAEDGERLVGGTVYISPGGRHMVARRADKGFCVGINDGPLVNSCRPSVDVLFRSLVDTCQGASSVLTVILTGMGADGASGVETLSRSNSYNIAQDEASCIVYGMPKAVVTRGLADEILQLGAIGSRINDLTRGPGDFC